MRHEKKVASGVSIIGGADGPTSIFIVGKDKNRKRKLSERIRQAAYRRKRNRVEKKISAAPHEPEEVVKYIQEKYNAVEVPENSRSYLEEYKSTKQGLILKNRPELLEDMAEIEPPKEHSEKALRAFFEQIELQARRAEEIPDELFPLDFHIYEIKYSDMGSIRITLETVWGVLSVSYSGKKKIMKRLRRISRDIYLYYGVSEEDIKSRSERYSALVTVLSC